MNTSRRPTTYLLLLDDCNYSENFHLVNKLINKHNKVVLFCYALFADKNFENTTKQKLKNNI